MDLRIDDQHASLLIYARAYLKAPLSRRC